MYFEGPHRRDLDILLDTVRWEIAIKYLDALEKARPATEMTCVVQGTGSEIPRGVNQLSHTYVGNVNTYLALQFLQFLQFTLFTLELLTTCLY